MFVPLNLIVSPYLFLLHPHNFVAKTMFIISVLDWICCSWCQIQQCLFETSPTLDVETSIGNHMGNLHKWFVNKNRNLGFPFISTDIWYLMAQTHDVHWMFHGVLFTKILTDRRSYGAFLAASSVKINTEIEWADFTTTCWLISWCFPGDSSMGMYRFWLVIVLYTQNWMGLLGLRHENFCGMRYYWLR